MNLAYNFPIIFWNCANLIVDSGGTANENEDEEDNKSSTDYKKIAIAINKMRQAGIKVEPPDVNHSNYTFTPDVENNRILFGLSGIMSVGEDIITSTIAQRPYKSARDYLNKVNPNKTAMISLIKAGAFDEFMERKLVMAWYMWETCDKKSKLNLQNMKALLENNIIPDENRSIIMAKRAYEFTRYLKSKCKFDAENYKLDDRAIDFLNEINKEDLIKQDMLLSVKVWKKIYDNWMNPIRTWLAEHQEEALQKLNDIMFLNNWNDYASGNYSSWEMKSICYYYHDHELKNVNKARYGLYDFSELPEDPVVERTFGNGGKLFKLYKICGTCLAKRKEKGQVTILTNDGNVVTVKFRKEYFSLFDKQISEKRPDGTKKVLERSWFNRGSLIMVQGFRSGDSFIPKKYSSSIGHQLYKIDSIDEIGNLTLRSERYQGEEDEDNGING